MRGRRVRNVQDVRLKLAQKFAHPETVTHRNRWLATTPTMLRPVHQPLKARVAPERGEGGVNFKPARRQVVRDLEQRLKLVEGALGLAHEQVDAIELVLGVGPTVRVTRDRREGYGTFTPSDGL